MFGQLSGVTLPDGRVISCDLDAFNRVIAKRVNGVVTQGWLYKDGLKPIAETDASGNIVSHFVYGTSPLIPDTMIRDGATYRLIRDVQGSVRLVVNADTGAIAQRLDYDSFGRCVSTELMNSRTNELTKFSFQPFGFQSGLYDPDTGLVHFGARWYDAQTGRWLSKDPILIEGGLNLYAFCGNDPVNFNDHLGLSEKEKLRDGEAEAQKYVALLRRDKKELEKMLFEGDVSGIYAWSTQDDKDLAKQKKLYFAYRDRRLNGPQQGNVDAAYAFTRVYHTPLAGIAVSIGGECAGYFSRVSNWEDAKGSFAANWIGIKEGTKDNVIEEGIYYFLCRLLP